MPFEPLASKRVKVESIVVLLEFWQVLLPCKSQVSRRHEIADHTHHSLAKVTLIHIYVQSCIYYNHPVWLATILR